MVGKAQHELCALLVAQTENLQRISFSGMRLGKQAMGELVAMLQTVLFSDAPLTHLELQSFSSEPSEGKTVMESLIGSEKCSFEAIILRDLPAWF